MARTNAMLTEKDRKWLRGEEAYPDSRQRRYQRRQSIVSGIEQTLTDFSLLVENLNEDEELAQQLDELFDLDIASLGQRTEADKSRITGLTDMLVFVFLMVTDELSYGKKLELVAQPNDEPIGTGDYHSPSFLIVLYNALDRAYQDHGILLDGITLHMEGTRAPSPDRILRDLEADGTLDPRVVAPLIRSGAIDMDGLEEFVLNELSNSDC